MTLTSTDSLCRKFHRLYCDDRVMRGLAPYWTGGDYDKLDDTARADVKRTVGFVLESLNE